MSINANFSLQPIICDELKAMQAGMEVRKRDFFRKMEDAALSTVEKENESDLTDKERAAILFCAGVPYDFRDGKMVFLPSGITKVDGKWVVGYREG